MSVPISNAKDRSLSQNSGTLPDMTGALLDYFQVMIFMRIGKIVDSFMVKETPTAVDFRGVIQPFSAKLLSMKPEGQRAWNWYMLHADPSLTLQPDEVVEFQGTNYRVKGQTDYGLYAYVTYELIQDYEGTL